MQSSFRPHYQLTLTSGMSPCHPPGRGGGEGGQTPRCPTLGNLYSWTKFAESLGRKQGAGHQIFTSGPARILAAFLLTAFPSSSPAPCRASSGRQEAFSTTCHKALHVTLLKRRPLKTIRLFYSSLPFFFSSSPPPRAPPAITHRAKNEGKKNTGGHIVFSLPTPRAVKYV